MNILRGAEIVKASGGSDLEMAIAARRSIIQLEMEIKLLTLEFGLEEGSGRVSDLQDSKKRSVSPLEEEEEEEEVKSKTIFFDRFPPD